MVIGRKLKRNRKSIVYGVTAGTSAYSLLRGQLAWFSQRGWDVTLVANPDEKAKDAAEREGVPLIPVPMSREISLLGDFKSLCNWIRVLRTVRPAVRKVSAPKAGLLGGNTPFITRVSRQIYFDNIRLGQSNFGAKWIERDGGSWFEAATNFDSEIAISESATDIFSSLEGEASFVDRHRFIWTLQLILASWALLRLQMLIIASMLGTRVLK